MQKSELPPKLIFELRRLGLRQLREQNGNCEVVAKVIGRMAESNREIADIAALIRRHRLQTNLIALNAAVEAARAGEQAGAFAQVAPFRNTCSRGEFNLVQTPHCVPQPWNISSTPMRPLSIVPPGTRF